MTSSESIVLVTGATGAQGGATAHALFKAGYRVRVLVRDPGKAASKALAQAGAELAIGDLDNPVSVGVAMTGAYAVFSVQVPDTTGIDSERLQGFTLVDAACKVGVQHFVHTSVCETDRHTSFPRWGSNYWYQKYWADKWEIEEAARNAGFVHWTVLKPAFMMDNFAQPKARFMFPHLHQGKIISAMLSQTRMQLIAASDVGAFAAAAIADPAQFDRKNIDLAAEALTMDEVATTLSRVLGRSVRAQSVSPQATIDAGLFPGWVRSQEWSNEVGYRADIAALKAWGIPLTSLEQWVQQHREEIIIDS